MTIAPPVETVRVDERAKNHLVNLKRRTGIENWNVLCRWALCASLGEPSSVSSWRVGTYSNVEMTWLTFAGRHADLYAALVTARCEADGLPTDDSEVLAEQFRLHLHRGISYLVGMDSTKTLEGLASLPTRRLTTGAGYMWTRSRGLPTARTTARHRPDGSIPLTGT